MNGERYLLDPNAIIAVLRGHQPVLDRLRIARWVGISILSQIEFLAFPELSDADKLCFAQFLQRVEVVDLASSQTQLIERIIEVRRSHRLKLPDAIIVATALHLAATLLTGDQQLLNLIDVPSVELGQISPGRGLVVQFLVMYDGFVVSQELPCIRPRRTLDGTCNPAENESKDKGNRRNHQEVSARFL